MGRRGPRRERAGFSRNRADTTGEVERLQALVARLERVLVDVLEASDAVVVDLRMQQSELALARQVSGFEELASSASTVEAEAHDFFTELHLDARARRWLLAPRRRSLLSRVRFGRTQRVRPPLLPRLRPAMALSS